MAWADVEKRLMQQKRIIARAFGFTPEWGERYLWDAFDGDPEAARKLAVSVRDRHRAPIAKLMFFYGTPPAALRELVVAAITQTHRYDELGNGSRKRFNEICRRAAFPLPSTDTGSFTIYRGVHEQPAHLARFGRSWTLDFNVAAWFACRCGPLSSGRIVLEAVVAADEIVFYDNDREEAEVIPAKAPSDWRVIEDQDRIFEAAGDYKRP